MQQLTSDEKIILFQKNTANYDPVDLERDFYDLGVGESDDFIRALTCALIAKESIVHRQLAIKFLQIVVSSFPEEPAAHYELAIALDDERIDLRIRLLRRAFELSPDFRNAQSALLFAYMAKGRHDSILRLESDAARPFARTNSGRPISTVLLNYLRTIEPSAHPGDLMSRVLESTIMPRPATLADIYSELVLASEQTRPFALVRLGDGEGAMVSFEPDEEIRNTDLYLSNREHFSNRWYGEDFMSNRSILEPLQAELTKRLASADVIGHPDGDWVRHEARNGNMTSFSCCLNAARLVKSVASTHPVLTTRTSVHYDLLGCGALADLINRKNKVALVSSHAQLPQLLRQRFPELDVVHAFRIAPAYSDLRETRYSLVNRAYSMAELAIDSFEDISREALVLVGAGYVGKTIVLRLKALGFMVIDVGSIFDHILGFATRPNFAHYDLDECFTQNTKVDMSSAGSDY